MLYPLNESISRLLFDGRADRVMSLVSLPQGACVLSNDVTPHGPAVNYVPAGKQLIIISALDRSATERLQYLLIPSPYVYSLASAVTVTHCHILGP